MVRSCSVLKCTQRHQFCIDISFHAFPQDPVLVNKWLVAINRPKFKPTKHSKVCSKHFTADSFTCSGWASRKLLKKDAVPTIFENLDDTKMEDQKPNNQIIIVIQGEDKLTSAETETINIDTIIPLSNLTKNESDPIKHEENSDITVENAMKYLFEDREEIVSKNNQFKAVKIENNSDKMIINNNVTGDESISEVNEDSELSANESEEEIIIIHEETPETENITLEVASNNLPEEIVENITAKVESEFSENESSENESLESSVSEEILSKPLIKKEGTLPNNYTIKTKILQRPVKTSERLQTKILQRPVKTSEILQTKMLQRKNGQIKEERESTEDENSIWELQPVPKRRRRLAYAGDFKESCSSNNYHCAMVMKETIAEKTKKIRLLQQQNRRLVKKLNKWTSLVNHLITNNSGDDSNKLKVYVKKFLKENNLRGGIE